MPLQLGKSTNNTATKGQGGRQKDRKTERQKDRKTERQKDRKTERQKNRKTERQKDRKTEILYLLIQADMSFLVIL